MFGLESDKFARGLALAAKHARDDARADRENEARRMLRSQRPRTHRPRRRSTIDSRCEKYAMSLVARALPRTCRCPGGFRHRPPTWM